MHLFGLWIIINRVEKLIKKREDLFAQELIAVKHCLAGVIYNPQIVIPNKHYSFLNDVLTSVLYDIYTWEAKSRYHPQFLLRQAILKYIKKKTLTNQEAKDIVSLDQYINKRR